MKKRIEYEFTADEVAEWVKARIENDLTLNGVGATLKNLYHHLECDRAGIIAFCEARGMERDGLAGYALPDAGRFLPRRPDDVPAPPDGWVYVGMGRGVNTNEPPSLDILQQGKFVTWFSDARGFLGNFTESHYAIRWTAPADIWHRFGLLAPSEGGGWIPHTPGDPMPCDGKMIVRVARKCGNEGDYACQNRPRKAECWCWGGIATTHGIIGWRPALEVTV